MEMIAKTNILRIVCVLFFLQTPFASGAGIDPDFHFTTVETDHFVVHYHQELENLGPEAAAMAEEIHTILSPALGWEPREKTHLVLIDSSDLANGRASVLPYNAMFIHTSPPLPDMTIGQYHNWLKMVITHEYAHILVMDNSSGYSEWTRTLFGKPLPAGDVLSLLMFLGTAPPNIFLPDWYLEGISVWAESEFTPMGRGKGTTYEMIFRTAVYENNLLPIAQINGNIPYWPAGRAPYIYGYALTKYLADRFGKEALTELTDRHAGRFPYFLNGAASQVTGSHYGALYREMLGQMKTAQQQNIARLELAGISELSHLDLPGETLSNPRFSKDGKLLAYNIQDPHQHEMIQIVDSRDLTVKHRIRRKISDHAITWDAAGETLYFTQAELHRGYNLYQDLYAYDLKERQTHRLTTGKRFKDPDVSPESGLLAAVQVEAENQHLVLIDRHSLAVTILKTFFNARISQPRWSADGRQIVFSIRNANGSTALVLYDNQTRLFRTLVEDFHDNNFPSWSRDNKAILFTSNRTGVDNLFALNPEDASLAQITNLISGAFQPEHGPDGILFAHYQSTGMRLAQMAYSPESWHRFHGPIIAGSWPAKATTDVMTTATTTRGGPSSPPQSYSAADSLLPKFWLPTLSSDHDGLVAGAFTAGGDVLGYHAYRVEAGIGEDNGYYDIAYAYDRYYPTITLSAFSRPLFYSELFHGVDLWDKQTGITAAVTLPLRRLESHFSIQAGYQYLKQERLEGPLASFTGRRDTVFADLTYDNALSHPYSISQEEGRRISFSSRVYDEAINSDINGQEYRISWEEYFPVRKHSVLYAKLAGAAYNGDLIAQRAFRLGGAPGNNNDFPLRGHAAGFQVGNYAALASLEFRQPIWYMFRGINTKPIFFDRLHLAPFVDAGIVWDDDTGFRSGDIAAGIGLEARMDMVLGYKMAITPALGIARGITEDGETQIYLLISSRL